MADYSIQLSPPNDPFGMNLASLDHELDYEPDNSQQLICSSPESESDENSSDDEQTSSSDSEAEKEEGVFSESSDDSFPELVS